MNTETIEKKHFKPSRTLIENFEKCLLEHPQLEIQTTHYFADGMYAREIFIPKGTILTGKVHKTEHLNIISQGKIVVFTEEGLKEVSAPFCIVSILGTKRVGYALEDTVWTTIHSNEDNLKDLHKLEEKLIEKYSESEEINIKGTTEEIKSLEKLTPKRKEKLIKANPEIEVEVKKCLG